VTPPRHEKQGDEEQRPFLKVISGNATEEEIAAIVAVLAAVGSPDDQPARRPTPAWAANHRKTRESFRDGRGGWRSSALPR